MREEVPATPPAVEERRASYDTDKPFAELVRPHFFGSTEEGELVEVRGEPDLIVEVEGKAKIRLVSEGGHSFLDPLALESELIGEHPVHKVYRLMDMGVEVDDGLLTALEGEQGDQLFTTVEFEYQRRRFSSGVIAEVFLDGTFLVIPAEVPPEWQSSDDRISSPTHLHLNSRAFSGGSTDLARDYELEILSLPFEDQRYPPAPLALKQCRVYEESLATSDYAGILKSLGFRYTPGHISREVEATATLVDRAQALLWNGSGAGVQYFGFEGWWIAGVLKGENVPWLGDCDTAGGFRAYPGGEGDDSRHYLIVRRSLEPDKKQRYKVLEVNGAGEATELYTAPGIILMALPLPYDARSLAFQHRRMDGGGRGAACRPPLAGRLPGQPGQYGRLRKGQIPHLRVSQGARGGPVRRFRPDKRGGRPLVQHAVRFQGRGWRHLGGGCEGTKAFFPAKAALHASCHGTTPSAGCPWAGWMMILRPCTCS